LRERFGALQEVGFAWCTFFAENDLGRSCSPIAYLRMWAPTPATPNTGAGLQTPGGGFNQIGTAASGVGSSSNVSHEEHLAAQLAAAASVVDVALSREDRTSVELWDLLV
jgi:hypothetical protein